MDNKEVMMAGHFEIHLDGSVTIVIGGVGIDYDKDSQLAEEFQEIISEIHNPPPMGEGYSL